MRSPACLLALTGIRICLAGPLAASPAEAVIDQRYEWPDGADLQLGLRWADLQVGARRDRGDTAAGASLPWMQAGPLVGRGMLRLVSDPLGFSASSAVFEEPTSLVLDASLRSARRGAVLMPLPGLLGVFVRQGVDGTGCGAFASIRLGAGAVIEGLVLRNQPEPRGISEDWYLDRSPSPGAEMTHLCGRLRIDTPSLAFSLTAGESASEWASPGAFAAGWLRARSPAAEVSLLLCAVTPGFRSPDGNGPAGQSLVSTRLRLGADRRTGTLEAEWSHTVENPGSVPGLLVPTRSRLGVALCREEVPWRGFPVAVIVRAEKEISRGGDGVETESARFSSVVCAFPRHLEARAVFGLSGSEGALLGADLAVRPSSRLRLGVEARLSHVAAAAPAVSLTAGAWLAGPLRGHTLELGLEDYPLRGKPMDVARFLRFRLSTSIRVRGRAPRGIRVRRPGPTRRPG